MTNSVKRHPYRAAFVAMLVALAVACSGGGGVDVNVDIGDSPEKTLEAAMQADRDFAAMAKAEGPEGGLPQIHARDRLQIPAARRGGAGRGEHRRRLRPVAADFNIDWAPDGGHGSASGDLAVTTGLYAISIGGQTIEKGRYVTVWRRTRTATSRPRWT